MKTSIRWLARERRLRSTRWDVLGRSAERRLDRQLLADYEDDIGLILARLVPARRASAIELIMLPQEIRGLDHVRQKSALAARQQRTKLREALNEAPGA
jgi:indolepyruvate ferredoxin oxidoreductase